MSRVQRRSWDRIASMGRFAAGVVAGASLSCALASAAQLSRHDGGFWSRLAGQDKTAYVAGYSDAMHTSLGKLDGLKVAADVFRWKGANKILGQVRRELDMSGVSANDLVTYLDGVYSNPRFADFDVAMAIELAAMHGVDSKTPSSAVPPVASATGNTKP
jgi:hypothetical protein